MDEKTENFGTNCKSCIFSQYEDGRQTGCDLERLDKYTESHRTTYDETTQSYTINTICNCCRGERWADKHMGKNLIATVEEEIKIPIDFIILSIDEDIDKLIKNLPNILSQCVNQDKISPGRIILVLRNADVELNQVYQILIDVCNDIPHRLVRIVDYSIDLERCLDLGVQKCKCRYFVVFDTKHNIPKNLILTINNLINTDLKCMSMVKPVHGFSGLIMQTSLYKIFGGNAEHNIIDKISQAAKIQEKEEYIYNWEKLWTNQE